MIKAILLTLFFIVNVALAYYDADRIKKGGWIYHGINGLVYGAIVAVPYFFFNDWWLVVALLFNRLLVFNIALSVFRKLPWDYVTPERRPKPITDRIAKYVFKRNGALMYAVYLAIFIFLTYKSISW